MGSWKPSQRRKHIFHAFEREHNEEEQTITVDVQTHNEKPEALYMPDDSNGHTDAIEPVTTTHVKHLLSPLDDPPTT